MVRERKLLRKTYTSRPLLGWRTLLRRSRADREFRNLDSLRAIEVPCVEVVDWRETRAFGCVASCSLDSVYLPNSGDLQSVLRRASDPAERRELATALGRLLHHMHDRGVCSTTMSLRNVLVHDGARLAICDQPFALFLRTGRLSRRLAQVDLFDTFFSPQRCREWSRGERWRGLLAYCGDDRDTARRLWRILHRRFRWTLRFDRNLARLLMNVRGVNRVPKARIA
ncbi:MAG: hypothetical protein KDE27_30905 [Planctomycetes bacterium]|nr:hypothetical protein [Planctomycetota bacterium]